MRSETLFFTQNLNPDEAGEIVRLLESVKGVNKVIFIDNDGIRVDYESETTSVQELRAALHRAGIESEKPAHSNDGMCCGSCGG